MSPLRRVVLVTGGTGFIGRWAKPALAAHGFKVVAPNSRELDLHDPVAVERVVAEISPTHLLHLAWYVEPDNYRTSVENLRWVEASLRLLRTAVTGGVERVVMAGTSAEYEWQDATHCVEGETPLLPATLYGSSKNALRAIAEIYAGEVGLSFAWGRIFFAFGPHEHPSRLGGAVARALVRGEPVEISHGEQLRDFLYTEELGSALAALTSSGAEGAMNVASGEPIRVRELVAALARAAGREDLPQIGARPASRNEPGALTADTTRLRNEVGWSPSISIEEAAARTIKHWRWQDDGEARSSSA